MKRKIGIVFSALSFIAFTILHAIIIALEEEGRGILHGLIMVLIAYASVAVFVGWLIFMIWLLGKW
ncbi:MAG: hypothetical protein FWB71_00790 [Defluviitaleaceae bacterium]|nr:hypothetical protein [Defluviitaleaceae bacterium]